MSRYATAVPRHTQSYEGDKAQDRFAGHKFIFWLKPFVAKGLRGKKKTKKRFLENALNL